MKKRHHLRSDGEVVFASILERVGCLAAFLFFIFIGIIGLKEFIRMILKIF